MILTGVARWNFGWALQAPVWKISDNNYTGSLMRAARADFFYYLLFFLFVISNIIMRNVVEFCKRDRVVEWNFPITPFP